MASNVTRDHHNLRRNLKLNGKYISNDGGNEGISISDTGHTTITGSTITSAGTDTFLTLSQTLNDSSTDTGNYKALHINPTYTDTSGWSTIYPLYTSAGLLGAFYCTVHDNNYLKFHLNGLITATSGNVNLHNNASVNSGSVGDGDTLDLVMYKLTNTSTASGSHAGSTTKMTGMRAVMTGRTEGTQSAIGIDLKCTGADTNTQLISRYDDDNYCSLSTVADGATTIATVDDGGGVAGHLTLDVDGDIELNADGGDIAFKDDTADLAALSSSGLTINNIAEVGSDTDKILMSDSGVIKYVTGANLRGYIGAGTSSVGALNDLSDVSYSSGDLTISSLDTITYVNSSDAVLIVAATSAGTDGRDLTVEAGSAPTGSADQSGGDLILKAGGGDGTGTSIMTFSTKVNGTDAVAERMRIHTDGSIGIGTNSPDSLLNLEGSTNPRILITSTTGSTGAQLYAGNGFGWVGTYTNHPFYIGTADGAKVKFAASGAVGIGTGTTDPGSLLEVTATGASSESDRPCIEISSFSDANDVSTSAGVLKFHKSANDTFNSYGAGSHTAAGEVIGRIEAWGVTNDDDGSSDAAILSSYIEFAGDAVADETDAPGKITFATADADDGGSPTTRMTIDDGGNVGIGVTDPDMTLEVLSTSAQQKWSYDADSFASMTVTDNSITTLATGESGNFTIDSAGLINLDAGEATGATAFKSSGTTFAGISHHHAATWIELYENGGAGSDTFAIKVAANGATEIQTTDGAGADANLTIDIDGDITLDCHTGKDILIQENGSTYTPSADAHVATKKYVDDTNGVCKQTIVTMSGAEADDWHNTAKELVPAQGSNITIIPLNVWMFVDRASTQSENRDMYVSYNGTTTIGEGVVFYYRRWMWNESGDRILQPVIFAEMHNSITSAENQNLTATISGAITSSSITSVVFVTRYTTYDSS